MRTRHASAKRKRCIVEETEVAIAGLYKADRVFGLYPSDPPSDFPISYSWVRNEQFWREILVNQLDFPVAKVKQLGMIQVGGVYDERLKQCTRFMDREFFHRYNYSSFAQLAEASLKD
jgi:hypothetical protein